MASLLDFTRENNFLGLFARVRIKTHFQKNKKDNPLTEILLELLESSTFIPHKARTSGEFGSRKVSQTKKIRILISPIGIIKFWRIVQFKVT